MNRFFAPGGEFSQIERMFDVSRFAPNGHGLGDDAFVWTTETAQTWVASTDASVEGVHFRLDWVTRPEALRKALLSNLSDINAMGGRTRFALFALGATPAYDESTFAALGDMLRTMEAAHDFRIVGGDTTRSQDAEFFNFTVLGVVEGRPLLRGGARPGHHVYVSGTLGGSAGGLDLWRTPHRLPGEQVHQEAFQALRRAHVEPAPPLALGPLLTALQGTDPERRIAAIDVSDGLSSELWHLARQSGCALTVDFEKLPAHPALSAQDVVRSREYVLHGGEEYQLLFTGEFSAQELARLRAVTPVTAIGQVTAGEGVFLTEDGITRPLQAGGYSHGSQS